MAFKEGEVLEDFESSQENGINEDPEEEINIYLSDMVEDDESLKELDFDHD